MLLSCSSSFSSDDIGPGASPDAMTDNAAADAASPGQLDATMEAARIPSWTLEDIQTDSAMLGQVYGLDTFTDKILVVVVVQGF